MIDNNSTDGSRGVVESYKNRLPIRYMFEENQGLSYGRNKAMSVCEGGLLLFTDDDVEVSSEWLMAFSGAAEMNPCADYFGGKIFPRLYGKAPAWLRDESMALISGLLGYYDLGPCPRAYKDHDPIPFGANFAIRRRMFEQLAPFRVDLGSLGDLPGRGEETEYLTRARSLGFQGIYVGNAVCHHVLEPSRLRLDFMYRYGIQKGIAELVMGKRNGSPGSITRELLFGARGVFQLIKGRGDRFRQCVINMGMQRGMRKATKQIGL